MTTIEGDIDLVLVLATLFVCLVVIPALCVLWLGWITRDAPKPPGMKGGKQ